MTDAVNASDEFAITLPLPNTGNAKTFRKAGKRFGEQLGEKSAANIRLAEKTGVLTEASNNLMADLAIADMRATADDLLARGYSDRQVKQFERGMRRGYKDAMNVSNHRVH